MANFNKLDPGNVAYIEFCMPFQPFPSFWIHIQDPLPKFHHAISNAMEDKVMFHLGDPSWQVKTIKLTQVHFRKIVPDIIIH